MMSEFNVEIYPNKTKSKKADPSPRWWAQVETVTVNTTKTVIRQKHKLILLLLTLIINIYTSNIKLILHCGLNTTHFDFWSV